jgi:hypothetical protein
MATTAAAEAAVAAAEMQTSIYTNSHTVGHVYVCYTIYVQQSRALGGFLIHVMWMYVYVDVHRVCTGKSQCPMQQYLA